MIKLRKLDAEGRVGYFEVEPETATARQFIIHLKVWKAPTPAGDVVLDFGTYEQHTYGLVQTFHPESELRFWTPAGLKITTDDKNQFLVHVERVTWDADSIEMLQARLAVVEELRRAFVQTRCLEAMLWTICPEGDGSEAD